MKKLAVLAMTALAVMAVSFGGALAEWKPPGPIKLLIAFRAGGGVDTQARMIAEELEKRHGWKIIPENVTGKGGVNMAAALKGQPNDGTVIGFGVTETLGYNMMSAKNRTFSLADFTPITTTAGSQMGLAALTKNGWKSFDDVVAAAKGGQKLRFGAMTPKMADIAYLLGKKHGIEFNIVSTKGGKGVMNGLNAGDLDLGFMAGIQAKAVLAGEMVNLVSGETVRLQVSPDAPTLKELGLDYWAGAYFLVFGPAGMSDEARSTIAKAITDITSDPATKAGGFVKKAFGGPVSIQGAELDAALTSGVTEAERLLKDASE